MARSKTLDISNVRRLERVNSASYLYCRSVNLDVPERLLNLMYLPLLCLEK
jgi:hypothetical protein